MLAGVLRSEVAVAVSLRLINTFVAMRKALVAMTPMLTRLEAVERRQITDQFRNTVMIATRSISMPRSIPAICPALNYSS